MIMMNNLATPTTPISSGVMQRARYGAEELREFQQLIETKLNDTNSTLSLLEQSLLLDRNNGTDDTSRTQNLTEDGQATLEREEAARMVARQRKFQQELRFALMRIEQGTYGIGRATGKLIPAERLRAVPHATMCVEAKK
jgi:DnaK suppressor protein